MRKIIKYILNVIFVFLLVSCGKKVDQTEIEESEITIKNNKYYIVENQNIDSDGDRKSVV